MNWLERLLPSRIRTEGGGKRAVPEGVWDKCPQCAAVTYRSELIRQQQVCGSCGYHFRIGARHRLEGLFDEGVFEEIAPGLRAADPLKFRDSKRYRDRLSRGQKDSGEPEALLVGRGRLMGIELVAAAFEFRFLGGSMGAVVGEKFFRAVQECLERDLPLICFSSSGGARMQEGLQSLMQMAKTSAALARLSRRRLPYISVLTDPTTGGVSASLAMLGDINIAEPGALIGFAGPRVIEQTVRETLPDGFQRSEFLLKHGAIDMIVDRRELRATLAELLALLLGRPSPADRTDDETGVTEELPAASAGAEPESAETPSERRD